MNRPRFLKSGAVESQGRRADTNRAPRPLADVLDALLRERGWTNKPGARGVDLGALWKELLGEPLASSTRVTRLDNGRLWVSARSAAHKCLLVTDHVPRLLEEFKSRLGAGVVREIRVRVGAVEVKDADSPVLGAVEKPKGSSSRRSTALPGEFGKRMETPRRTGERMGELEPEPDHDDSR